jgi:hypothetical protein
LTGCTITSFGAATEVIVSRFVAAAADDDEDVDGEEEEEEGGEDKGKEGEGEKEDSCWPLSVLAAG